MADPQDLLRLADEVERYSLTGPYDIARERGSDLNERIAVAIGLPCSVRVGHPVLGNDRTIPARIPAYTTSIDAVMSLLPEGAHYGLGHDDSGPLLGWAWIRVKTPSGWHELHSPSKMGFRHAEPWPQSPALALCAAALKARAHSTKESDNG